MTFTVAEFRHLSASAVFELEDRYARERGVGGSRPPAVGQRRFLAMARMRGGGRQTIDPPLELEVRRNLSGYDLFFGIARGPAGDRKRLDEGTYVVRVETGGRHQRAERDDVVIPEPRTPYVFELSPGYAYAFPSGSRTRRALGPTLLRGALQEPSGGGITGATVQVVGMTEPYLVDESGQWVLTFSDGQPSASVTVRFQFPDGSTTDVRDVPVVAGRQTTLPQTTLRGHVLTAAATPIARARITVSGQPGQSLSGEDGAWSYFLGVGQTPASVDVTARLADGRRQTRSNVPVQPRATLVVPSFRFP